MKNKTFWQSIKCAVIGLKIGYTTEKNFKYYTAIALTFFAFNIFLRSSLQEYCFLIITTACVFSAEYANTAIEHICNVIQPEFHINIKIIKDIAAAAVLVFGIAFFSTQALILLPKII